MIAKQRIGLTAPDAEGKRQAVPAESPASVELLVGAGCELDDQVAREYGIKNGRLGGPEHKQVKGPRE